MRNGRWRVSGEGIRRCRIIDDAGAVGIHHPDSPVRKVEGPRASLRKKEVVVARAPRPLEGCAPASARLRSIHAACVKLTSFGPITCL
ncbi:hypothetical protein EVAR_32453_1 [Eumeta japonica]|uniref:Uncharacterized protein n=1 Tax=Eumeta variegata TaxID=151549 RepID=A0A4C1VMZ0_EUMVA|nr:hypothetical protein EVAR_32453_1 [Eumeta japonica]